MRQDDVKKRHNVLKRESSKPMALNKEAIRELYRKRAGNYDVTANLYYFLGFRAAKYRKMAISQFGV